VAIDTSGKWWVGDSPTDIEAYLTELRVEGYDVDRYAQSRCSCGGLAFRVEIDRDNEAARRICTACGTVTFLGDSEEYFEQENIERYACVECPSDACNVGVGFSLYEAGGVDIRWVSVGVRCAQCGVLGCFIDWKLGGGNDSSYFDRV
jgi:hypothetical protein